MNPTEWRRITDLFARAAELESAERARLLQTEEESVRREVERLLIEHEARGVLDLPAAADDRWIGKILNDRYRIERFLARGGAGAVYLARDEPIAGRAVVVKFLEHRDAWLKNKFREEIEALARIDHPGVVGILDAGATPDGLPFLVIEFIDGVTLRSEIQKGPMPAGRAARLIRQIGGAVSAAHKKGVLHRDLKPENIMLERPGTPEETVRLIDFGIARVDRPEQQALTHTTRFAGTTPYMAPEQLAGHPQPASDIYALGVIAYEMLAGRRPFLAASPVELYEQQRAGIRRGAIPGIAPAAMRPILKQLSFRPENRAASAHDAAEQVALGIEGRLPEEWSRRKVAAVLASGAGVAAAGGAYLWTRSRLLDPSERVIEVLMGSEIREHGFQKSLDIDYRPLQNADATAIDSIRVSSSDQGEFFHPLSAAQADQAHLRGWTLIVEAALEQGRIYWGLDNSRDARQYSPYLERNANGTDTAGCLLVVAPSHQGIDWVLPGPAGVRRRMVMKWRPSTEAEFWVDGASLISGYRGFSGFRYARGLKFGATRYLSAGASAVFWKIRLEIG